MHFLFLLSLWSLAYGTTARMVPDAMLPHARRAMHQDEPARVVKRSPFSQNANATRFAVNGSAIPEVDFDIGESYAGNIPIDASQPNSSSLWFWFFPSENPAAEKEIVIWFNGCSGLTGLLQENGPFLWQAGVHRPVPNPWSWNNLTNVLYAEHAADTGYSRGPFTALNEEDIGAQFASWYKNFAQTFGLEGYKIYVTGESFGGMFVPYTTDAMLAQNDPTYYDVQGIKMYDPSMGYQGLQTQPVAVPYVDYYKHTFNLNDSFMADIHARADSCGYTDYIEEYMTFPPSGVQPTFETPSPDCDLWTDIRAAATLVNPCFNVYQLTAYCPLLFDPLGFPGSVHYMPSGVDVYFNRTDVQAAVNAPPTSWSSCSNKRLVTDDSLPSAIEVLPRIIPHLKRTVIGHGDLDYILINNGTLLTIQNMTWNGGQGLSAYPDQDFFVPYHSEASMATWSASGVMGKWRTERNVTYIQQYQSGHMVPQFQPSAAYRQLEFLLGRISDLGERSDFTTQTGDFGNKPGSSCTHSK